MDGSDEGKAHNLLSSFQDSHARKKVNYSTEREIVNGKKQGFFRVTVQVRNLSMRVHPQTF